MEPDGEFWWIVPAVLTVLLAFSLSSIATARNGAGAAILLYGVLAVLIWGLWLVFAVPFDVSVVDIIKATR